MNNSKIRVQHKGSSLQDRMTFIPRNIVNSLFLYKVDKQSKNLNVNFTLKDSVFEAIKFTKNADRDK